MAEDLLLDVEGVSKRFPGVQALKDVHLRLRPGSVHALCGGNGAGKSTFLNILMGIYPRDGGRIRVKGEEVRFATPRQAMDAGISIIQQELSSVLDLTVAENIYLGREPRQLGVFVRFPEMNRQAGALLERLNFDIDPSLKMRELSLAERQLVEIAKALSQDADIIVMDEPTSAIGEAEVERLFDTIRLLTSQGKGVVYVSHRLSEIFQIADSYTVFRDGQFVGDGLIAEIDRKGLIQMILGVDMKDEFIKANTPTDDVVLKVRDFSRRGQFQDISLDLRSGEILGIYGLMGSGRSEFFSCLFGIDHPDNGTVEIRGKPVRIRKPSDAMDQGLALVTEDRKETGLVLTSSVRDNISMASLPSVCTMAFVNQRKEQANVGRMVDFFHVRTPSTEQIVRNLSGGNQQKVVLGRWLLTEPQILLLDEPTRGIDVGSKREMYGFMSDFAKQGHGVIMISSEVPEVLGMSDRILVFRDGRMVGLLDRAEANQETLVHLAA